ncbi:MAG: MBL fold metallo-hydrolase [Nanoarchaeota archaeon]|nr:MBL fold metallo-hydrolase [Nanoarchaeota archaeon]
MEIANDVYKIKGDGNVYLILKPTPTIIDTSDPVDSNYIKSEIEKIIPLEKIKIVLLTHLHYDHSGNVNLFPNAEFYADKEEIESYKKNPKDFFFHDISQETHNILKEKLQPLPEEISELEVIKVPGHTKGSVAFLDKKRKLLFSGDTIFANGIGRTDFNNSLPEKMEKSVNKLIQELKEGNLQLCSGHDY